MVEELSTTEKPLRILVEHCSRRKGGNLFHIYYKDQFLVLSPKEARAMARKILKIGKET